MNKFGFSAIAAIALALSAGPALADQAADVDAIRTQLFTEMHGVESHDIGKIMSVYWHSKELIVVDAVPGKFVGWDAVKADYENYYKAFPGKTEANYTDVHVYAFGDFGYAISTQDWTFSKANGEPVKFTQRVTDVYRKIDGHFVVVHEHASVPVDLLASKGG